MPNIRKYSDECEREIISLYIKGKNRNSLAHQYGCSFDTITDILKRHKVDIRRQKSPGAGRLQQRSPEEQKEMVRLYNEEGRTLREIANLHNCSVKMVTGAIKRRGNSLRQSGKPPHILTDIQKDKILSLWKSYVSIPEISTNLNIPRLSVRSYLQSFPDKNWLREAKHKNPDGYIQIRVVPDDPCNPKRGEAYVMLEHRYVMSKYLGRLLSKDESVHHVNGVRDDNRIENLQLRIGKHGSGQVCQCVDCGSRNIRTVEIA